MFEAMISALYEREYQLSFRMHTTGMEDMPIAPETLRAIACEASAEVDNILADKRDRLYAILRKRRK